MSDLIDPGPFVTLRDYGRVHRRNTLPVTLFPGWLIGTIDSRGWYVVSTHDSSIYLRRDCTLAHGVGISEPNCGFWPTCQEAIDALGEFIAGLGQLPYVKLNERYRQYVTSRIEEMAK